MKSVSQTRRVIRVSRDLHREVKGLAALEGQTIESLADAILAEALEQRLRDRERELRAVATASLPPVQTRG